MNCREPGGEMQCPKCKNEIQKGCTVCPFCGKNIPQKNRCVGCGKLIDPFWISCPFCDLPVVKDIDESKAKTDKFVTDEEIEKFCHSCGKRLYTEYMQCSICTNFNCLSCKDVNYRGVCITCGEVKFKEALIEKSEPEQSFIQDSSNEFDYILRSTPIDVTLVEKQTKFHLHGSLPIEYISNKYYDNNDNTITDNATGLMWQQAGSNEELLYKDAKMYVNRLNSENFACYNDWRFPTIDELISLLELDAGENSLNINPIFDYRQKYCWSADRCSFDSMWNVHLGGGGIYWDSINSYHCVRAVRKAIKDI